VLTKATISNQPQAKTIGGVLSSNMFTYGVYKYDNCAKIAVFACPRTAFTAKEGMQKRRRVALRRLAVC
jgi:hypothetical protein